MASVGDAKKREEIREIVKKVNAAWQRGRPEELSAYFHEDMVMAPPGLSGRAKGREACVASYREFIQMAKVKEYKETEPEIDIWGNTAAATYGWEMVYELKGETYHESGWDVFVFAHDGAKWQAVWRTIATAPHQQ